MLATYLDFVSGLEWTHGKGHSLSLLASCSVTCQNTQSWVFGCNLRMAMQVLDLLCGGRLHSGGGQPAFSPQEGQCLGQLWVSSWSPV